MARLYLHIGTHKTGSTQIQASLSAAKFGLLNEKIAYLPYFPASFEIMCLDALDKAIINKSRGYLLKATREFSNEYSFILSFEGFSGDLKQGYRNAPIVASILKEITDGFDVYIIVYLRRQDSFLESTYTQFIHQGESLSFPDFIKCYDSSCFDWYSLLTTFAESFEKEKLFVRRYEKQYLPDQDSLIDSFASIIKSSALQKVRMKKSHNVGYDRDTLEIARLCNPYLEQSERKILRRILQASRTRLPLQIYSFLLPDERRNILDRYSDSNAKIFKEYFGEDCGNLFADDVFLDKTYEGLTPEGVAKIFSFALVNQLKKEKEELKSVQILRRIESFIGEGRYFKKSLKRFVQLIKPI